MRWRVLASLILNLKTMKMYDSYFPHEASASNNNKMILLIEDLGMKGYGVYWVLLEHLRMQTEYRGDVKALGHLARRIRSNKAFLMRVICDYELFEVEGDSFYSPGMQNRLVPLDDRRKEISEMKRKAANAKWQKVKGEQQPELFVGDDGASEESPETTIERVPEVHRGTAIVPDGALQAVSFWESFVPPTYAQNKETHNFEGVKYQLEKMKVEDPSQLRAILQLADYGRKGNPFWRLTIQRPLETWRGLKSPGIAVIRALKKYIISQKDAC